MNTTKDESSEPVVGTVERPVRPCYLHSDPSNEDKGRDMSQCAQCENPNLKGIHTCGQKNQFSQTGPYWQASMQELLRRQHGKDDLLMRLLDLNEVERDRVLRALGL